VKGARGEASDAAGARGRAVVRAFCLLDVLYVSVAANAVELGKNNRFRLAVEPPLTVLIASSAAGLLRRGRRMHPRLRLALGRRMKAAR
jgi:hypothetical protein